MTEYSMPMPGTTLGDAGPYAVGGAAAPGWWDKWGVEARAGGRLSQVALADIGVFYCVDDQLECTVAADTTSIDVDEGAALIDGIFYWNDTDPVNVPIPAAGAGDDRIDLIVVRKNFQAVVTYTPGGGAPTVPFRETRITVIRGTEAVGPVAPTATQDVTRATYWDIPLCSVQVDDAGVLTDLTDLREYVDAETKNAWVPVMVGYNVTDVAQIVLTYNSTTAATSGIVLPDTKEARAIGNWIVPADFISGVTTKAVIHSTGTGNVYSAIGSQVGDCGESAGGIIGFSLAANAVTAGQRACVSSLSISPVATNDKIAMIYRRDATDPLDTLGQDVDIMGFEISYFGWKR